MLLFYCYFSTHNERNSLFLLDWTEEDPGVDHDSVEVTVNLGDTLHGTRTSHEGLSRGRTPVVVVDLLQCWWRVGGHLGPGGHRVGGHRVGGQVGRKTLCQVLLDVDWSRCGLAGTVLWAGITRDRTSMISLTLFSFVLQSSLTSAKADVGAAVEAAESVVQTVEVRGAGTPAGRLSVGAQLDGRQD